MIGELQPIPGQPVTLEWNDNGSYTPRCFLCEYQGVPRTDHAFAVAALRQHITGPVHRRLLRRVAITRERAT